MSKQVEDQEIYKKAETINSFVVTIDDDFKKLVKKKSVGILIIPAHLSNEEIDHLLNNFVSKHSVEECWGRINKL